MSKPYQFDINDLIEVEDSSFFKNEPDAIGEAEFLRKGKALPIGTMRTWGGQDYIKHADGWVHVGSGKLTQGKKMEHVENHANAEDHRSHATKKKPESKPSAPKADVPSQDDKNKKIVSKLEQLQEEYKADGKSAAAKVIENKIKEVDPSYVSSKDSDKAKKKAMKQVSDISHFKPDMVQREIDSLKSAIESGKFPDQTEFYTEKIKLLEVLKDNPGMSPTAFQSKVEELNGGLNDQERKAIGAYQGDSGFGSDSPDWESIQQAARSGSTEGKAGEAVKHLESAINKQSLAKPTKVYRGTSFSKEKADQIKPGVIMTDSGFSSTTKDKSIASNYSHSNAGMTPGNVQILYQIDLPKGAKAYDFANRESAFDDLNAEKEILLNRNVKFKVLSVSDKDGVKTVKLELLDESQGSK